jgi:hypothetical protein
MLNTNWLKLCGLAALQGGISLSWLIYNVYLPKLLIGYGFPASMAVVLLAIENAIAVLLEPLFGSLSDRAYRWLATKFGFISVGVILSATLFIIIPTLFVFRSAWGVVSWIFIGVIIAWAMAMTVFRSPAISLIGRYAIGTELPLAMSFLTLTGGTIAAFKPTVQNFLLSLGAPIAFATGSIVLLAATAILRYFDPPTNLPDELTADYKISLLDCNKIAIAGFAIAWAIRCLFETLPKLLKLHFQTIDLPPTMLAISLGLAILAVPGSMWASKIGNQQAMTIGIMMTVISLSVLGFVPLNSSIALLALLPIFCFCLVTNGGVPWAIELLPIDRIGLAIGLYFGGFSGGIALFSWMFDPLTKLSQGSGIILADLALAIVAGCLWQSRLSIEN